MNNSYKKYIENRLKVGSKVSSQHLCAITAVDYYGASKDFYLLQFYETECLLLKCATNDSNQAKRIGIVSCSKFQHGLNEVYKSNINKELIDKYEEAYFMRTDGVYQYDSFYNKLSPALNEYKSRIAASLNEIQLENNMSVYVCYNKYYSTKAVVYALQEKVARVILMQEVKENLDIIESKRVLHLQDFSKMYLNAVPVMSVADCFSPQTMYIPVSELTLDSEFCNGKKWRDLIANTETSDCCIINGVQCKCVTIKMKIDIFNNIFCTTQSLNGEQKTILLHNALEVNLLNKNIEPAPISNPIIPTSKPTSNPITEAEILTTPKDNPVLTPEEKPSLPSEPDEMTIYIYRPIEGYDGIKLQIDDGETYSIEELFGYYLLDNGGVTEICFRDAYLYWNMLLLKEFIKALTSKLESKLINFRSFKIITLPNDKIKTDTGEAKKRLGKFEENISKLAKDLKKYNVEVIHDYIKDDDIEGSHKRIMTFDNGWCIDFEGGLNKLYMNQSNINTNTCSKTTLYYYNVKRKYARIYDKNPYYPPKKGKKCTVKVIKSTEENLNPEVLFRYYLLDDGGTSHIIIRDKYLTSCPKSLQTLIEKLIGFSKVANRDNKQIKLINRITLFIDKKRKSSQFEYEITQYIKHMKKQYSVNIEIGELSKEDKDGEHKRCLIFEDNGWCIDMEGGLDKLYKNENDMSYGRCQNTALYYCKEK